VINEISLFRQGSQIDGCGAHGDLSCVSTEYTYVGCLCSCCQYVGVGLFAGMPAQFDGLDGTKSEGTNVPHSPARHVPTQDAVKPALLGRLHRLTG
jgi:hypothetical protein